MPPDSYHDDLSDFIRHHRLDAYELTDDELAEFLEVWRWSLWMNHREPSIPDADVLDSTRQLQRRMAHEHNVEVDYNTLLLLKQEAEPLMYLRVLTAVPRAVLYFLRLRGLWALFCSLRRVRRYEWLDKVVDKQREPQGHIQRRLYPRLLLERLRERAPDLAKRAYWRPLSSTSLDERKRLDFWL
ncbi:MAG: hypothetical protein H7175_24025 [Burkholderiales bacterium]|nr:hypothetical protein [Anaerolineae bacterium]